MYFSIVSYCFWILFWCSMGRRSSASFPTWAWRNGDKSWHLFLITFSFFVFSSYFSSFSTSFTFSFIPSFIYPISVVPLFASPFINILLFFLQTFSFRILFSNRPCSGSCSGSCSFLLFLLRLPFLRSSLTRAERFSLANGKSVKQNYQLFGKCHLIFPTQQRAGTWAWLNHIESFNMENFIRIQILDSSDTRPEIWGN